MGQKFAAYDAQGAITGYYDSIDSPLPSSVTAIEITDEEWYACLSTAGYTVKNGALVAPVPPTTAEQLAALQASLCGQIDSTADAIYTAIGGPSPGRLAEYEQASNDAQAFKSAGYSGTVPATIACWVTASGMTAQEATDNIIATAQAWESALTSIRSARLLGKKAVNSATSTDAAQAAAQAAIAQIQAVGAATT